MEDGQRSKTRSQSPSRHTNGAVATNFTVGKPVAHHSSRRIPVLFLERPNALERKLAANRRDALKLTGSRPSEGKRRVRLNAWNHGRLARTSAEDLLEQLVRRRAHGGEDQKKSV